MGLIKAEPAATERVRVTVDVCGACRQTPYPSYVVWDLPGFGRVAACSHPTVCRQRGEALGIWCTYEPLRSSA